MLSRRHCPHTGIVNFFAATDPLLAIGSVIRSGEPAAYHWRYYMGGEPSFGVSPDMRTAENHLISRHRAHLLAPAPAGEDASASDWTDRRTGLLAAAGKR